MGSPQWHPSTGKLLLLPLAPDISSMCPLSTHGSQVNVVRYASKNQKQKKVERELERFIVAKLFHAQQMKVFTGIFTTHMTE